MEKNIAACLDALGFEYTANAMEEMDKLIYHAPLPKSAGPSYVRTGRLRASQIHQTNPQNKEVVVGNTVNYAVHVEMPGLTRNWSGRPFMKNALNLYQKDYQDLAEAVLGRGFE